LPKQADQAGALSRQDPLFIQAVTDHILNHSTPEFLIATPVASAGRADERLACLAAAKSRLTPLHHIEHDHER
jgi:hypothetical protein